MEFHIPHSIFQIPIPPPFALSKPPEAPILHRMFRQALNLKRFLLLAGDIVVLQAALVATLFLRYDGIDQKTWQQHAMPFAFVTAFWVIGLFVTGLYDLSKMRNSVTFFRTILEAMFVNLLIAFAFFYLIPVFGIAPRTNLLLYFAIALLFLYAWRLMFNRFMARDMFRNNILFIGRSEDALALRELLSSNSLGFVLPAVIHTSPRTSYDTDGLRWEERIEMLDDILGEERISTIVLGHSLDEISELREALYRTLFTSTAIIDRRELEETLTGRVPVASVGKAWFLEHLRESEKAWFEVVKRGADIILAVPVLIITIILYPLIALAIKLTTPGPVLFRQERVGRGGRRFNIIKFRTMRQDAEANGAQFATSKDPRVTSVGRFLRATRLDELPQVWNVLRGDMSFVGPRPERPEFVDQLTERMPYYALRHLTRPGLTGWAQVQYRYASTLDDNLVKLQYDLYYVKHRSLLIDAMILLKTINTVLRRQGT
jgi:exopolysaccharide biosynthesis polyprenyl glycosylphosphotransferase